MSVIIKPEEPKPRPPVHTKPIVVQGTRVLTPLEYKWIRRYLPTKAQHVEMFDALLFTGMRAVEFEQFVAEDFQWYDQTRRCIVVPEEAVKKTKVEVKRRAIMLSDYGIEAIHKLINMQDDLPQFAPRLKMSKRAAWGTTLKRAAYKSKIPMPETIVPKMTRKTWESWLILTNPNNALQVAMSQGHCSQVALRHYIGLGWSMQEREEALEYTKGFIQRQPGEPRW